VRYKLAYLQLRAQHLHALLWMLVITVLVKLEFIAVVSWTNDLMIKMVASDEGGQFVSDHINTYTVSKKTVQNYLCQNFVKFTPTVKNFLA